MKGGALALVGTSAIPSFSTRSVMAEMTTADSIRKISGAISTRGGGWAEYHRPYREQNYYAK
jgi:hypothetical protein